MSDLRTAAQQALEFLDAEFGWSPGEAPRIDNLRAALAQQAEPVEPVAWIQPDHLQKARVAPFLCRVEPTQRCADFVPLYLAPPKAEPVQEPVAWLDPWTRNNVTTDYDAYGKHGIPLYTAPPQRKPLTEEEMYSVEEEARKSFRQSQRGVRGQQITYWDGLTPWLIRAVERAHGIKE